MKILINAGHGGSDPGAVGNGVKEKEANLLIALGCANYLYENYVGFSLVMPRTDDTFLNLRQRQVLTQREKPDIYVSIHNNAFSDPAANGYETFIHTNAMAVSAKYRDIIHDEVFKYVRTLSVRDRGKKRADHFETRMMPAPVVLMEYMFVTNVREASLLRDTKILSELGKYTAIGIAKALGLGEKDNTPRKMYRIIALETADENLARRRLSDLREKGFNPRMEVI